ncbi:MAG: hypothetical protein SGJ09_09770 [Phycisphaerae bacterium]|nr:hypothetical protein [Phycisphaerae bacterium]
MFARDELLGNPPAGVSIYEQTNRWILNTAVTLSSGPILGVLVWDGKDSGDGPGGTSHFQRELLSLNCTPRLIDPRPTISINT